MSHTKGVALAAPWIASFVEVSTILYKSIKNAELKTKEKTITRVTFLGFLAQNSSW